MKDYSALTLQQYLDELSSDSPVPGGGSVAAYGASLALGLMQMVARITLKRKPKPEEEQNRAKLADIVKRVEELKVKAMKMVSTDPHAYNKVMECYANKSGEQITDQALRDAFRMQADLARDIAYALDLNGKLAGLVTGAIKNDLLVAQNLLKAAFQGAYHTAHINTVYIKDTAQKNATEEELAAIRLNFGITGSLS